MQHERVVQLKRLGKMYSEIVPELLERVESLEHLSNQHDILVNTLGDIMEELKKQERLNGNSDET